MTEENETGLVKWGDFTVEDAEQAKAELDREGSEFMKTPVGRTRVRILPGVPLNDSKPFIKVQQHFVELPDGTKFSFACPTHHARRPCPSCTQEKKLLSTGNMMDAKAARSRYKAKPRIFCNAIDRGNPEGGVQILAFGKQIWDQICALRDNEERGGNPVDPTEKGFDTIIERVGTTKNDTEYTVYMSKHPCPLGDMTLLEQAHPLKRFAIPPAEAELIEMLGGGRGGARGGPAPGGPRRGGGNVASDFVDSD